MVAARMLRTSPVNARGAQGGVAAEIKAAVKQALDANNPSLTRSGALKNKRTGRFRD